VDLPSSTDPATTKRSGAGISASYSTSFAGRRRR